MSKRLLISGLGGSLFPYLHEKLAEEGYICYYVDSNITLKEIYPSLNFFPAPVVTDSSYASFITDICVKESIEVYIPLIDEEILIAQDIAAKVQGLTVLTPTQSFAALCMDKYTLMHKLKECGISNNVTYKGEEFDWQIQPPLFLKPNSGRGSRGIRKINSQKELEAYYVLENYSEKDVIIQSFVDGIEYTVSVLTNQENKIVSISPKRILAKKGITISAVTEDNALIETVAEKINKELSPGGPYNIQLFITKQNEVVIFEINPRFSTTLVLSYAAGLKEITLLLNHLTDKSPDMLRAETGKHIYRRWQNVFY